MYKGKPVAAVVAAGGSGERFCAGSAIPKQFLNLKGIPVIARVCELIQLNAYVDYAVMVTRTDCLELWKNIAEKYGFSKFVCAVSGGGSRQASVYGGICKAAEVTADKSSIIVIHDGVRPLATQESLNETIEAADTHGGAVASVPIMDTVKAAIAHDEPFVAHTPDRALMYAAQTPQAFRLDLLLKAYEAAFSEGFTGTDDASLVERAGGKVKLTGGSYRNIKITRPEDLLLAETLMQC